MGLKIFKSYRAGVRHAALRDWPTETTGPLELASVADPKRPEALPGK